MGHCNTNDVLKLENVVEGMEITDKSSFRCDICSMGKMSQSRNREKDEEVNTDNNRESQVVQTETRYPKRDRKPPKRFDEYYSNNEIENETDYCCKMSITPQTYSEAMSSPYSADWYKAMKIEIDSLIENNTYELKQLPEGRKSVGGKWVYSIKLDKDANEQFAPTARFTSQLELFTSQFHNRK
ncbi:hypothetical protein HELRODRAFT_162817 [Helobdella robusta]|uniref:Reverse transcriptase Ty1/copia-type domain-containing protein n=1 Tax=Helobdella robusta TaxID=6412 RepID=T1ET76_HELRO|nr:hypothetical protein HELRODRAFT_162817 [Helobdella robusta]ESN99298.1 hypothetical protein HELRODRAFT_162817 [Helobdella robusta]